MKVFTYKDYLNYKNIFNNLNVCNKSEKNILNDTNEEYKYNTINNEHDKIFKIILEEKEIVTNFLNNILELTNTKYALKKEDLCKYRNEFITSNFIENRTDVIYQKKNTKIFFHIEHQSSIDYSMPYRLIKYNVAIMESVVDEKEIKKKDYKIPMIFSFIIYTGKNKWDVNKYISEKQEKLYGVKLKPFDYYKVIDSNNYTSEELIKKDDFVYNVMAIDKSNSVEQLIERYIKLTKKDLENKEIRILNNLIRHIYEKRIGYEKANKLSKILKEKYAINLSEMKGDDEYMLEQLVEQAINETAEKIFYIEEKENEFAQKENEFAQKENEFAQKENEFAQKENELVQKENELNKREKNIIIEMLKNNIKEEVIIKITKISMEELNQIKKEI